MEDRAAELLPVEYFHVVFTLPDTFNQLALANKRTVYGVLFEAVAQTLSEVAANSKRLGAKIGFIGILHTWGQNLSLHPHVHCVVPGGGISPDGKWISCKPGFFLPVRVLSRVFRGKFIDLLKKARGQGKLIGVEDADEFGQLLNASVKHDWVVYAKRPFGGPQQVLKYLARYTHRIAISNRRLIRCDSQSVTFKYKDYARHHRKRTMTLDGAEFLRRFLMHAVPGGFMRIRHFGLLANRVRAKNLERCRTLASSVEPRLIAAPLTGNIAVTPTNAADHSRCPVCGHGRLIAGPNLSPLQLRPIIARLDSS
jgi:predicted nucleic acid-binding Zn ribbon protein